PSGAHVVVLSYAFWQSYYGGQSDVLGRTLSIGPSSYTIIGVAPRGFAGMSQITPAAFVPIAAAGGDRFSSTVTAGGQVLPWSDPYSITWLELFVRRRPGVTADAAAADLSEVARRSYLARRQEVPSVAPIEIARPRTIVAPVQDQRGPNAGKSTRVAV